MVTNGMKTSLPFRAGLTLFAAVFGWLTLGRACYRAYASAQLTQAAEQGQAQEAIYWLGRGADINARDRFGDTPLMVAARNARPEVVQELLRHGANARLQDDFGLSAAHWASFHLHDSRAFRLPTGFEIRQVSRPEAVETAALLQGRRR